VEAVVSPSTARRRERGKLPGSLLYTITHNDPPQSAGLLWTSNQFVTGGFAWLFSFPPEKNTFIFLRLARPFPFKSVQIHNSPVTPTTTLPTASQSSTHPLCTTKYIVFRYESQLTKYFQTMCCHFGLLLVQFANEESIKSRRQWDNYSRSEMQRNETIGKSRHDRKPLTQPSVARPWNYKQLPMPCVCTGNETSVSICSAL
jgi:hypothetical protein